MAPSRPGGSAGGQDRGGSPRATEVPGGGIVLRQSAVPARAVCPDRAGGEAIYGGPRPSSMRPADWIGKYPEPTELAAAVASTRARVALAKSHAAEGVVPDLHRQLSSPEYRNSFVDSPGTRR